MTSFRGLKTSSLEKSRGYVGWSRYAILLQVISKVLKFRVRGGFALMVATVFALCVLAILAATMTLINRNLGSGAGAELSQQARYSAAAGIREVLQQLARDPNWTPPGGNGSFYQPSSGTLETLSFVDPLLGFEVQVINNFAGSSPVPRPGGGSIPEGQVWMKAYGTYDGRRLAGHHGWGEKLAVKPEVKIDYALFETTSGCEPKETVIRSYSSEPFIPEAADPVAGTNLLYDTHLRAGNSFQIIPPVAIDGSLILPAPSSLLPPAPITTGGVVYDPVEPLRLKFRVPHSLRSVSPTTPTPTPGTPLPPGRYTDLNVYAGSPVILRSGVYVFDNIYVHPGARIDTLLDVAPPPTPPTPPPPLPELSPVVVYVRENFGVGMGSQVNTVSSVDLAAPPPVSLPRPRHFQLYTTDEGNDTTHGFGPGNTNVQIAGGGSEFVGIIAGDRAVVGQYAGSTIRGGMTVGRHVWGYGGATVVYDRTLTDVELEGETEWVLIGEADG